MIFRKKIKVSNPGEKIYSFTEEDANKLLANRSQFIELEPGMGGVSPSHLDDLLDTSSKLVSVDFALTSNCNFRCVWCYRPGEEWGSLVLKFDTIERVVSQSVDLGVGFFVLTGGEPLVYKDGDKNYFDVVDIIQSIYDKANKKVVVLTFSDVALIDETKAKMLADRKVGLCLKRDTMTGHEQDAIIGKEGGSIEMERGYQCLFDVGYGRDPELAVSVNSVVAKGIICGNGKRVNTLNDMIDLHRWVMSNKMEHSMVPIHYCGEAEEEEQEEGINVIEVKALYDIIAAIDEIEFDDPWVPYSSFPKNKTCVRPGRGVHVRATGKITSCSECPLIDDYIFGDIETDNLIDIVESDKFLKLRTEFQDRTGEYICNPDVCDLNKYGLCRGGCATRASFSKLDVSTGLLVKNEDPRTYSQGGEDPLCPAWAVLAQKQSAIREGYYEEIVCDLIANSNLPEHLANNIKSKVISDFDKIKGEHISD